jgi:hypothetical protein
MPMLNVCGHQGCETLTLGGLCIAHEPPIGTRVFPRGRPFPPLELRRTRELPSFLARESIFEEREELVKGFA